MDVKHNLDEMRLRDYSIRKQMILNAKKHSIDRIEDLFVSISRDEYETLLDLAIQQLRSKLIAAMENSDVHSVD